MAILKALLSPGRAYFFYVVLEGGLTTEGNY